MKIIQHMLYWAKIILPVCCFTACNYLDVVPPETADFDDTMRDKDDAIGFLYSCYSGTNYSAPWAWWQVPGIPATWEAEARRIA